MSRLIINADDFGLTSGVNRAIAELHQANALTSATLMATGPAFEEAVAIARANPKLGVGCHIILTDGVPVSRPDTIPTLLAPDRKTFRPSLVDFIQSLLRGTIREEDIEREATAQITKLQRAGIRVTHLDTHKHTHLFPTVTRPLLRVAERANIRAIRNPFEQPWSLALGHGNRLRRLQVKLLSRLHTKFEQQSQIHNAGILTTDGTIGISATGHLDAPTLHEILQAIPTDHRATFELCCHPGYNDLDRITTRLRTHRNIERNALILQVPTLALHPNAPKLIHYGDLGTTSQPTESTQFATSTIEDAQRNPGAL